MKLVGQTIIVTVLLMVVGVCGYKLWSISRQYFDEKKVKNELSQYRPELPETVYAKGGDEGSFGAPVALSAHAADVLSMAADKDANRPAALARIVNQSIVDLQSDVNHDIIGWLTIPNTRIDYPFVIAGDNDFYLRRDVHRKLAAAGSIFMDYRCPGDLTGFNTVIYGHNMKNGSMFGSLRLFADPSFFDSNVSGVLFVKDNTYLLEIFAYMVVRADDNIIYDPSADCEEFFEYVKDNARQYREPSVRGNVVTLSTCAYEYDGARMVLLATCVP